MSSNTAIDNDQQPLDSTTLGSLVRSQFLMVACAALALGFAIAALSLLVPNLNIGHADGGPYCIVSEENGQTC